MGHDIVGLFDPRNYTMKSVMATDFASQPTISPITGEELQVKFLSDSEENSLKY